VLDSYRIRTRLKEINKRVRILNEKFKPLSEEKLTKDEILNTSAERNLQIAVQACIDIANHIVAAFALDRAFRETAEVFDSLAQEKIIPDDFANTMIKITAYRNVLVHGYLDVNRRITYENIQKHLSDLTKFAQYIEKFLEKKSKKP